MARTSLTMRFGLELVEFDDSLLRHRFMCFRPTTSVPSLYRAAPRSPAGTFDTVADMGQNGCRGFNTSSSMKTERPPSVAKNLNGCRTCFDACRGDGSATRRLCVFAAGPASTARGTAPALPMSEIAEAARYHRQERVVVRVDWSILNVRTELNYRAAKAGGPQSTTRSQPEFGVDWTATPSRQVRPWRGL